MHISDCELRFKESQQAANIFSSFIILFLKNSKSSQRFEKKKKKKKNQKHRCYRKFLHIFASRMGFGMLNLKYFSEKLEGKTKYKKGEKNHKELCFLRKLRCHHKLKANNL